jgi:predicted ATP-dependent serine protease
VHQVPQSNFKPPSPLPILLSEFLAQPSEPEKWVVDGMIPAGGLVLVTGKPKTGKTCLTRDLAFCVATGMPFLSRSVVQGTVLHLSLEEHPDQFRDSYARMNLPDDCVDKISVYVGQPPSDGVTWLRDLVTRHRPSVVIVDPLFRLLRLRDENSYAELSNETAPLIELSRTSQTAVVYCHHARKAGGDDGDGVLGSTAIFGFCDTALTICKDGEQRTVRSIQRYGTDLQKTLLTMDPETGQIAIGQPTAEVALDALIGRIEEVLRTRGEQTRDQLITAVGGDKKKLHLALQRGTEGRQPRVLRRGEGKKNHPYVYRLST